MIRCVARRAAAAAATSSSSSSSSSRVVGRVRSVTRPGGNAPPPSSVLGNFSSSTVVGVVVPRNATAIAAIARTTTTTTTTMSMATTTTTTTNVGVTNPCCCCSSSSRGPLQLLVPSHNYAAAATRQFSSGPPPNPHADKADGGNGGGGGETREEKEPISLFFEKRKAALEKEKEKQRQRITLGVDSNNNNNNNHNNNTGSSNNNNNNNNSGPNSRDPKRSAWRNQNNHPRNGNNNNNNSTRSPLSSSSSSSAGGFRHRQRPGQNRHERDTKQWNHNNNNNTNRENNNNNNNGGNRRQQQGLSDVLNAMSRNRKNNNNNNNNSNEPRGRRSPPFDRTGNANANASGFGAARTTGRIDGRNNNNNNNNNGGSKPEGTLRLAEMMRKLRKDAPSSIRQQGGGGPGQFSGGGGGGGGGQNHNQNQNQQRDTRGASWRQNRFSIPPPSSSSSSSLLGDGGDNDGGREQHQQRRRPNNNNNNEYHHRHHHQRQHQQPRGGRGSFRGPQPQAEEFLHGRVSRTEEDGYNNNNINADGLTTGDNNTLSSPERVVTLPIHNALTLPEVSLLFRVKIDDIRKRLRSMGVLDPQRGEEEEGKQQQHYQQQTLDIDTLELLAMDLGIETVRSSNEPLVVDSEQILMQQRRTEPDGAASASASTSTTSTSTSTSTSTERTIDSFPPRPPIVTIMGHVDHGKTTLMDALRRRSQEQQRQHWKRQRGKSPNATTAAGIGGGSKKKKKKSSSNNKNSSKQQQQRTTRDVAGTEAGGITQIISAFQVAMMDGLNDDNDNDDNANDTTTTTTMKTITFLDTPGHAAFRAMRQSGSHAADVIVLVVAADDGISEQTVEIIDFYKSIVKGSSESGISMLVAVNKIDKPGIDPIEAKTRIENQLLEHGIVSEGMTTMSTSTSTMTSGSDGSEYGQPVQVIPTSGLTGAGLDDLIEGLLLQSEMMDLRADDEAFGEGIIMDARQEKGLGVVADCIVRWGKIEKGNAIVSGDQVCQVRMLRDVNNQVLKRGLPSQPVRIVGFKSLPKAGDPITVVESEEVAEEMLEQRRALELLSSLSSTASSSSSSTASTTDRPDGSRSDVELHITGMRRGDTWRVQKFTNRAAIEESDGSVRIPIIVKADADGSLAAVRESLLSIGNESKHRVVIDPIMEGIGEVTPSDIQMAKESEATIFSFGSGSLRVDQSTMNLAESEGVSICSNNIIYSLLDEARDVLGSYLPPIPRKHTHGRAVVKAIFSIDTDDGEETIAGLNVLDGTLYKTKASVKGDNNDNSNNNNKSGSSGSSKSSNTVELVSHFRVYRDGELISPDNESVTASSLRRFKEMVESVRLGEECGLGLSGFSDFEEGDEIECYSIEMKKAKL